MTTATNLGTFIVRTPGICGGRPRIEGSRITVRHIVIESRAGITPEEILEDKPHLSLAKIYAALAYYYANKEEIDADIVAYYEAGQSYVGWVEERNPTKLMLKTRCTEGI